MAKSLVIIADTPECRAHLKGMLPDIFQIEEATTAEGLENLIKRFGTQIKLVITATALIPQGSGLVKYFDTKKRLGFATSAYNILRDRQAYGQPVEQQYDQACEKLERLQNEFASCFILGLGIETIEEQKSTLRSPVIFVSFKKSKPDEEAIKHLEVPCLYLQKPLKKGDLESALKKLHVC